MNHRPLDQATPIEDERSGDDGRFFLRWLGATFLGWLFGLGIALAAMAVARSAGIAEGHLRLAVGLGLGAGVGIVQGRVLKRWIGSAARWGWATFLGIVLPLVALEVARVFWPSFSRSPLDAVFCGLLAGELQRRLLPRRSFRAGWWGSASAAGWTFAAGTADIGSFFVTEPWGRWLHPVTVLAGGLVLGLVTGAMLLWIRRERPIPREDRSHVHA